MDPQQQQRFREAVARKQAAIRMRALQLARARKPTGRVGPVHMDQRPELLDDAYPPDERSVRAKSTRHGHVTADKWNQ